MVNLKLEVIRFEEPDIIATSGLGLIASGFGDYEANNGTFSFFGGSSGNESHNAHEPDLVSAFNSYFKWSWENIIGITLETKESYTGLGDIVDRDGEVFNDSDPDYAGYNGTYTYQDGSFTRRSN